ncbi:GNAT family N-acetyltransferase [Tessaracoccus sp.]
MDSQLCGSVRIRHGVLSDAPELAAAYIRNRDHLQPWEPVRSAEFYTVGGQQSALARSVSEQANGRGCFWVLADGPQIVGRISLNNIVRGVFLSGDLGYWVAADHQGRGVASAAVEMVCKIATNDLGLHRIQAGTLVDNVASQKVLERCSFTRMGVAPAYLRINGRWQDHVLFQRILHE